MTAVIYNEKRFRQMVAAELDRLLALRMRQSKPTPEYPHMTRRGYPRRPFKTPAEAEEYAERNGPGVVVFACASCGCWHTVDLRRPQ